MKTVCGEKVPGIRNVYTDTTFSSSALFRVIFCSTAGIIAGTSNALNPCEGKAGVPHFTTVRMSSGFPLICGGGTRNPRG